jgi:hypothetical protein
MARSTIDVELRLSAAAVVRPGDTLVVATAHRLSDAECHELRERVESLLPGVRVALVAQCTGLAVYQPDKVDTSTLVD